MSNISVMMEDVSQSHHDAPSPSLSVPAACIAADFRLVLNFNRIAGDSLRRIDLIVKHAAKRPLVRNIDTVFWDTADHAIATAGLALGIETTGRRKTQITQRILREYRPSKPPSRVESPLPPAADRPDPVRLAFLPGEDPRLAGSLEPKMLVPLFAFSCKRTLWALKWKGAKLQLCLDQGAIAANSGDEHVIQLTITVPEGPTHIGFEFARALAEAVPFDLSDTDVIERTYRRIVGEGDAADLATPLSATMSVEEGVLAIGRSAAGSLRNELATILGSDSPGAVHQTRVALRRLRSVLSVFAPILPEAGRRDLVHSLGTLASSLGEAREWDVFLSETVGPLERALKSIDGEDQALRSMGATAAVLREHALKTARKSLDGRFTLDLSLQLSAYFEGEMREEPSAAIAGWLERPLGDFAAVLLRKRHRKLQRMGEALSNPSPAKLHELRIEFKKLRYIVEFFASLFDARPVRRYLSAVKRLQELLGVLNDASVIRNLVPRLAGKARDDDARAAGIVAGWTAAEMTRVQSKFEDAWQQFLDVKKFW